MSIRDSLNDDLRLSASERQIADFMLAHPEEFIGMSISDVSERLYVSKSTIIRFAKKLGFTGHKELCLSLAKEMNSFAITQDRLKETLPFSASDPDKVIAEKILMLNFQSLTDTYSYINLQQLRGVADRIAEKRKVVLFGLIESFLVAADFQYKLMNIGIDAVLPDVPGLFFRQTGIIREGDLALLISFYGRQAEMNQVIRTLSENGAYVVLVTGPGNNPMVPFASEVIRINVNETHPKIGAISSRTALMLVLDIIYSFIFAKDFEKNKAFIIEHSEQRKRIRNEV